MTKNLYMFVLLVGTVIICITADELRRNPTGASSHNTALLRNEQTAIFSLTRHLQETKQITLKQIDDQMEMLQDEMEDLLEQKKQATASGSSTKDIDHLIETVQGQIDFVQTQKAAYLAKQQPQTSTFNSTTTELKKEAYEETEREEDILKEDVEELESEEHWTRYLYIALFSGASLWYLWFRHAGNGGVSNRISYQKVPTDSATDTGMSEIELGRQ